MSLVEKRFPANTSLKEKTFLNDKNIDGELYAYLQSISVGSGEKGVRLTRVPKENIPTQTKICEIIGIKSPKTLRGHLNYLKEQGYVQIEENGDYILPEIEDIYFMIPLKTLKYLTDNCREHVIKIYVYLGQKFKQKANYEFSLKEIGQHIGIKVENNVRGYEVINNALTLLYNSGLIDYCTFFDGQTQKKKLLKFTFDYREKQEENDG